MESAAAQQCSPAECGQPVLFDRCLQRLRRTGQLCSSQCCVGCLGSVHAGAQPLIAIHQTYAEFCFRCNSNPEKRERSAHSAATVAGTSQGRTSHFDMVAQQLVRGASLVSQADACFAEHRRVGSRAAVCSGAPGVAAAWQCRSPASWSAWRAWAWGCFPRHEALQPWRAPSRWPGPPA